MSKMNKKYLAQFNNENLKNLLIDRNNIPLLEHLLDREGQCLQRLQKLEQEGKLDFGPKVSRRDLSSLFSDVKNEVDSFLGTSGMDTPKHYYFSLLVPSQESLTVLSHYSLGASLLLSNIYWVSSLPPAVALIPLSFCSILGIGIMEIGKYLYDVYSNPRYKFKSNKSITFPKEKRANLVPIIAHEYTHFIQDKPFEFKSEFGFSCFEEGHAGGIERHIAKIYREKEDNEAFLYCTTNRTFYGLKSTYLWMCKTLGIPPRKSLIDEKTSIDTAEKPSPPFMGYALFYLYETQRGNKIYDDMLKGTFRLTEQ